jgi:hypothetical protein
MSDVTINLGARDDATPKVRKLKAEIDGLNKSAGRVGQSMARAGGPAGGIAGRALGGFSGGMAFGLAGAGAALAGVGVQAALAADQRRVEAAREQAAWANRIADARQAGEKARGDLAAGGLSFADKVRQLTARGGRLEDAQTIAGQAGLDTADVIAGESALLLKPRERQQDIREQALKLAMTGDIKYEAAVNRIGDRRNVNMVDELVKIRGQLLTDETRGAAGAALFNIENATGMDAIGDAQRAANRVPEQQQRDLLSGATADALDARANEQLDPTARALDELRREVDKTTATLAAAAAAQGTFARALAQAARDLGMGEGSAAQKMRDYQKNHPLPGK